jgi:putative CocE/NonD family hydrolase
MYAEFPMKPLGVFLAALALAAQTPQYPNYPSETPAKFEPITSSFDYTRRDVMIPMRDGVKLHTVVLVPKGASRAPILFTRTPYNADKLTGHAESSHLGPLLKGSDSSLLNGYDNPLEVILEGGYIRAVQDVRGKYKSEGDYVMNRPLSGPLNPTPVDHATDTYDTVDWLVKNTPESNGRVGILGISYDGFLPLMALINPHPALKVSVPMNPMVDGWMGDDWFHNGAFRQQNLPYIYEQVATRANEANWWTSHYDDFNIYMNAGSAGELAQRRGMEVIGFWRKILAHPAYDEFWREQAMDRVLAAHPPQIPVMIVHSLWDQEDIYGAMAVYKAIGARNNVFLVMGPWHHAQEIMDGSSLGVLKFPMDTALYFRQHILRPFLDEYLMDAAPKSGIAKVTAYETGGNRWQQLGSWPGASQPSRLYLARSDRTAFAAGDGGFDEYISDPAKPVPFRARPIQPTGYSTCAQWACWLVDDQREASGRPDVVVWTSEVLTKPLKIAGQPMVNLIASTSGTDSDWVVKLIDVYPDEVAGQPQMGGYQLMVTADIFRGRYRESFETAKAVEPNKPLPYRFALPTANHVFLKGHRLMVQVQSAWFPLYDRNPQTFVPNIFWAKPEDFKKATQRIYHSSYIELPIARP